MCISFLYIYGFEGKLQFKQTRASKLAVKRCVVAKANPRRAKVGRQIAFLIVDRATKELFETVNLFAIQNNTNITVKKFNRDNNSKQQQTTLQGRWQLGPASGAAQSRKCLRGLTSVAETSRHHPSWS